MDDKRRKGARRMKRKGNDRRLKGLREKNESGVSMTDRRIKRRQELT